MAPLQSFTNASPHIAEAHRATTIRPFRGFFPYGVFPGMGSHFNPGGSHPTGYVAPSGFLTLSALYSPHTLPGLFHPGPTYGVFPSRPFSSLGAVHPLERRAPLGLTLVETRSSPPGTHTPKEARIQAKGLAICPYHLPPWALPLQGFLAMVFGGGTSAHPPLSHFRGLVAC